MLEQIDARILGMSVEEMRAKTASKAARNVSTNSRFSRFVSELTQYVEHL